MATKKCKSCAMEIPSEAKICPHCRTKQGITAWHLFLILIVVVIAAGVLSKNKSTDSTSDYTHKPSPSLLQTKAKNEGLVALKSTWKKGGFDNIAIWTVTFENKTDKPIGNIQYRTAYYAETHAVVDKGGIDAVLRSKNLIQKVIKPHSKRTIEIRDGFLHHEAVTASFEIIDWEHLK